MPGYMNLGRRPKKNISAPLIDPDRDLKKAKGLVVEYYNRLLGDHPSMCITQDDLRVQSFMRVLGNWVAEISTAVPDDNLTFKVSYFQRAKMTQVEVFDNIHHFEVPDLD